MFRELGGTRRNDVEGGPALPQDRPAGGTRASGERLQALPDRPPAPIAADPQAGRSRCAAGRRLRDAGVGRDPRSRRSGHSTPNSPRASSDSSACARTSPASWKTACCPNFRPVAPTSPTTCRTPTAPFCWRTPASSPRRRWPHCRNCTPCRVPRPRPSSTPSPRTPRRRCDSGWPSASPRKCAGSRRNTRPWPIWKPRRAGARRSPSRW
jgi:hypothetical protein